MQLLLVLAVVVVAIALGPVNAFQAKCKGVDVQIPPEMVAVGMECMDSLGFKSIAEIGFKNVGCLVKCTMDKLELVDDKGQAHKENILKKLDDHLPETLKDVWKVEVIACLDTKGNKLKHRDDPTCSSFVPLAMCIAQAFMKIC